MEITERRTKKSRVRLRKMTHPGSAFRWNEEDARAYLRYIEMVRTIREHQDWRLDVSWLLSAEGQGVPIPAELQQYCVA